MVFLRQAPRANEFEGTETKAIQDQVSQDIAKEVCSQRRKKLNLPE